jgi:hypothetical protein
MKKFYFPATILLVFACINLNGQPAPARYGKIDMADLEMKVYPLDTTAEAVILCDFGEFNPNTFDFNRLLRIKILKKGGEEILNEYSLSIDGDCIIKGCTYNLTDGQMVSSKLKSESIFKERVHDNWYRYRVAMPDVHAGSIVDIQYTFPFLPSEWRFQDVVPVRWSELRITDSPYVTFQKVFYGFQPLFINENGRWVGKNMPALRSEPYMNSITNYLTKVEIELSNVMVPGYSRFYTSSWNAVNTYLLNHDGFGGAMGACLFLSDDVRSINERNLPDIEKMKAACDLIRQKVKWNDVVSLYTPGDLSMSYRKGSGNSAEINLTLVQLLKKLGFEAFPVALSTRSNGILSPAFPTIDKLNYAIAGVRYNGKDYLFDATESYMPAGMLPFRVLNGRGRIINDKYSDWVNLQPSFEDKELTYCVMTVDGTGEIKGDVQYTDNDYRAYYFRQNYKKYNSQEEYVRELESDFPGLTINSIAIEDLDSLYKPVREKYNVSLTGYSDVIGDMISISPMLMNRMENNPFKLDLRKYPIDYGHNIKKRFSLKLTIPEGYEVTGIPKPGIMTLPDKSAKFTYQVALVGNTISVNTVFEIGKSIYIESEYLLLKEFYNQVIAKQAEVIMLKKKI